jgi:hypothetical protein
MSDSEESKKPTFHLSLSQSANTMYLRKAARGA